MKKTLLRYSFLSAFISISSFLISPSLLAQTTSAKNKNPFPVKYTSLVDEKIILKTITLAPVYDNVNGIYAAPIQKLLIELLQNDKVWGYSEFPNIRHKIFVENFDNKPNEVLDALQKTQAQGLLTAFITKGPHGLTARLKLYTQDQGIILLEESFQDLNAFEISKLREEFVTLYHNLKNKLPYRGFVLSRRGIEVTLNLGSRNGVTTGQELTLAQIIKLNRHPKLKTLVGIEREIIGRLKVTKVEPYLSFAQITFEKETGVVDVGAKVLPTEYVSYPMPLINNAGDVVGDQAVMNSKTQAEAAAVDDTQDSQTEEKPVLNPHAIGKVTLQGGISQYSESTSLASGLTATADQAFAPTLLAGAQLFFLQNFFADFNFKQSYFNASHTLAGSSPGSLSYVYSRFTGALGYNYYVDGSSAGPKVTAALGLTSFKTEVTATTPVALTSTQTDGLSLKISGVMPLEIEDPVAIGADFQFLLNTKMSESPVNSGSSSPTAMAYGIFATYAASANLLYRFDMQFDSIDASFSGTATRADASKATTIKSTSQMFGIEYLF